MKIKEVSSETRTSKIIILDVDLKHIKVIIEAKIYIESKQLNLRMIKLVHKNKDKMLRKKHEYDYMKEKPQKYIKEVIRRNVKLKLATVWWEQQ